MPDAIFFSAGGIAIRIFPHSSSLIFRISCKILGVATQIHRFVPVVWSNLSWPSGYIYMRIWHIVEHPYLGEGEG